MRDGADDEDQLLLDPASCGKGKFTSVTPLDASPDGSLLLYELKQGGERMGTFGILDVVKRRTLDDVVPRGYLRGFAFAEDSKSFYYVHETIGAANLPRVARRHVIGTNFEEDQEIFRAEGGAHLRLVLVPGDGRLGFLVYRFLEKKYTDFFLWSRVIGQPAE
jgi:protease II